MWEIVEYHDSLHVMPVGDVKNHSVPHCDCGVCYVDGVYVHNSYDERELVENLPKS